MLALIKCVSSSLSYLCFKELSCTTRPIVPLKFFSPPHNFKQTWLTGRLLPTISLLDCAEEEEKNTVTDYFTMLRALQEYFLSFHEFSFLCRWLNKWRRAFENVASVKKARPVLMPFPTIQKPSQAWHCRGRWVSSAARLSSWGRSSVSEQKTETPRTCFAKLRCSSWLMQTENLASLEENSQSFYFF